MGNYVTVGDIENWDKVMRYMCACGHMLRDHGFTMKTHPDGTIVLYVSQCVQCSDRECSGFH